MHYSNDDKILYYRLMFALVNQIRFELLRLNIMKYTTGGKEHGLLLNINILWSTVFKTYWSCISKIRYLADYEDLLFI